MDKITQRCLPQQGAAFLQACGASLAHVQRRGLWSMGEREAALLKDVFQSSPLPLTVISEWLAAAFQQGHWLPTKLNVG